MLANVCTASCCSSGSGLPGRGLWREHALLPHNSQCPGDAKSLRGPQHVAKFQPSGGQPHLFSACPLLPLLPSKLQASRQVGTTTLYHLPPCNSSRAAEVACDGIWSQQHWVSYKATARLCVVAIHSSVAATAWKLAPSTGVRTGMPGGGGGARPKTQRAAMRAHVVDHLCRGRMPRAHAACDACGRHWTGYVLTIG